MKSNLFKQSVLTVGVVAAMGVAGTANAAQPTTSTADNEVVINNFASATYTVANTSGEQQTSISNTVTVNVTETGAFTLLATKTPAPDTNENLTINPQADQTVEFTHTLQNNGNVTDTYTIDLDQLDTDDFDYSGFTINYTTDGGQSGTITNGQTITLEKDEIATITIVATSNAQRKVGDNGALTVTASSAYLEARNGAAATATYQAVNTDNALTTTPIFAITKSARTSLTTNDKFFDTANPDAFINYSITIKNEGNADAKGFEIVDTLPTGLVGLTTFTPQINGVDVPDTNYEFSNEDKTLTIIGQNLNQNETITVTFRAKKDTTATIATGTTLTNYAIVRDNTLKDNSADTPDLIDTSETVSGGGAGENNYEDPNLPAGQDGKDDNTDASVTTRNQIRNITVTGDDKKEIPLISTNNVYTYTITNAGTDITEADTEDEVYFTVTPTTPIDEIDIVRVFVDTNGNGTFDTGDTELTAVGGNYDLFDVVGNSGLTAGQTANVSVELSSDGVSNNKSDGVNNINAEEVMTITVTAQGPVEGTAAPAAGTAASTTTLKGINLIKGQAVASCTSPGTLTYNTSDTALTGQPGECIYYEITAKNTFTEVDKIINTVAITDDLDTTKVTYDTNDFSSETDGASPAATQSYDTPNSIITATFATLNAGETGTVRFKTTISATGEITP